VKRALASQSKEVVRRVVRVLAQCGSTPEEILLETRRACDRLPRKGPLSADGAPMELSDVAHVLTVWFSDPNYLDALGNPRPLTLGGAPPSFVSLVARVNRTLDAREVLRYLLAVRNLKRIGARYVPRGRTVTLRGTRGRVQFLNLRVLLAMLRTFDHNDGGRRTAGNRFEFLVENPNVPRSARPGFARFFGDVGMRCLFEADGELRRRELARKPGEPTVRLGVGIFLYEDDEGDPGASTDATGRHRPRATSKRGVRRKAMRRAG
jgi:hypothetical protein